MVTTTATSATSSSGLDVNSIVTQLMAVERQPLTKLNAKEASYQAKLSAFGMLSGAMSTFQTAVQGLSSPSLFQALKATPSDTTAFSASTASTAVAGSYTLDVTSLAQSQRLVATGQTSSTAAIGTGAASTLTFDFGTITGLLNPATGHYSAGPTSTVASGAFTAPTSASGTGTYAVTIDGLSLQAPIAVNAGGTVVTAASMDASLTTFLSAHAGYSKTGSFATNNLVLTKADGSAITIATAITGDTVPGGAAGFVTTNPTPAAFASNGSGIKTVTIDSTNNSLQGIRDAINAANIGVTAAIINDGSGTPYRLTLTSNNMGVSNSMKLTVAGDATISGLLTNDVTGVQNMSQSTTAQNAVFNVNGVANTKTSNTVTDVIQGVTLNLIKPATGMTLTVARDTAAMTTAITGFVKAYNDLTKTLADSTAYNAATKQGATLQGDPTVQTLQSQLRSMLSTAVSGTSGALTTLSQIGITYQKDGSLALDSTKLSTAMTNNPNDIASLFASVGRGTDSLVSFNAASATTKPGNYAVNITQLATMGGITGNVAVPATGNVIASGSTISVTLNGTTASVALTAGTYTATQLATMIQSAINGTSALSTAGSSVAVTVNGSGFLNISSNRYGSSSSVSMTDTTGTAVATFIGTATSAIGVDVAGSIGGVTATGSGQLLSAASGDPQGLSIIVNGGALGARGTLNYAQGYATTLNKWATSVLASDGSITARTNGINQSIKDIGKQRDALNVRLVAIEARYRAQFTNLDVMLNSMNTTSTFLTQQLGKL